MDLVFSCSSWFVIIGISHRPSIKLNQRSAFHVGPSDTESVKSDFALAIEWVVKCFGIYAIVVTFEPRLTSELCHVSEPARIGIY